MAQATIATTVTGLQGHPIAATAPATGQALVWNGSAWTPDNSTFLQTAGGTITGALTVNGGVSVGSNVTAPMAVPPLQQVESLMGENTGRNYFHNPQSWLNQRGSSAYSPAVGVVTYTSDRWATFIGASGDSATTTIAQATDADRAAIGLENPFQYWSTAFTGGTGASNQIQFLQRVEDPRRLSNRDVTLSFWAYSPTSLKVGVGYLQNFGNGGSPSANVSGNFGGVTLTTGWARYQITAALPSIAGKTFGSAGGSYTQFTFYLSAPPANTTAYPLSGNLGAQSGTTNFWGFQLEVGTTMTPFEIVDFPEETERCMRFFQVLYFQASGYNTTNSNQPTNTLILPVLMRGPPTLTAPSASFVGAVSGWSFTIQSSIAITPILTFSGAGVGNGVATLNITADL